MEWGRRIGWGGVCRYLCCHKEHLMEKKMPAMKRLKGGGGQPWLGVLQQPTSTLRLIKWQHGFTEKEALKCSQPSRSNHISKWERDSQCLEQLIRSWKNTRTWLSSRSARCTSVKPHGDTPQLQFARDCQVFCEYNEWFSGQEITLPVFQGGRGHRRALSIFLQIIHPC